jgi:hypothetical protein
MASNAYNNSSDCEHRVKTLSAKLDRSRDLIINKISKIGKDTAKLKAKTKLPFIVDFDKTIEALAKKQFQNFDRIAMKSILDKTYTALIEAIGSAKTLLDDTKIHKDYWEITDEGTVYRFNYPIKVEDSEPVNVEEVPMLHQGTIIRDEDSGEYLATLVSEQTFFDRSSLASNEPDVAQFKDYNLIRCKRWVEISSGLE